ncbi:hypothetical protein Tco_1222313, partial [Tanacetum coccineum]
MDEGLSARMLMEHKDAQGERLRGLTVIAPALPVHGMAELLQGQSK